MWFGRHGGYRRAPATPSLPGPRSGPGGGWSCSLHPGGIRAAGAAAAGRLAAQAQILHDFSIPIDLRRLEIVQQTPALPDHAQQAATRRVVALVHLEVFGEVMNLLGEKRDLDLGRPRVSFVLLELADDSLLLLLGERHCDPPESGSACAGLPTGPLGGTGLSGGECTHVQGDGRI